MQNQFAVMKSAFPLALRTNESSVRTVVHQHELVCTALDVGMIATGLVIAIAPIILLYAIFSETMIKGMTAGAVR